MRRSWMFPVAAAIAMTIMAVIDGDGSSWFGAGFCWAITLDIVVNAYYRWSVRRRWWRSAATPEPAWTSEDEDAFLRQAWQEQTG